MADDVIAPKLGSLTQGTIFSCARAEDYDGCRVHGLVITARCDIAQSKVPVFNYLPIVTLDDWIHRDGRSILCDRLRRSVIGQMKRVLRSCGHAESILQTELPRAILTALFPP